MKHCDRAAHPPDRPSRPELANQLSLILNKCVECPKCVEQCPFLKQYGTPKAIAAGYDSSNISRLTLAFKCNLCGLCASVCPAGLTPDNLFLEMRREAVNRGVAPMSVHRGIMAYEGRGISKRYSWYALPDGCRSVFFPGCTFSGTRMDTTIALYEYLKRIDPGTGIVLDCCCKPSHDLGRIDFFRETFSELRSWLVRHGVQTVFAVCPNCHKVFRTHGAPLEVISVYEFLAEHGLPALTRKSKARIPAPADVSIHDPCVVRNEEAIHSAVRKLAENSGFTIVEMPHCKKNTVCCGEGGAAGCLAPDLSSSWIDLRRRETRGRRLLTYCAGCAGNLNKKIPTDHLLDAIFYPGAVAAGKRRASRPPWTYLNRIRLKRYFQRNHPAAVTRERNLSSVWKHD